MNSLKNTFVLALKYLIGHNGARQSHLRIAQLVLLSSSSENGGCMLKPITQVHRLEMSPEGEGIGRKNILLIVYMGHQKFPHRHSEFQLTGRTDLLA